MKKIELKSETLRGVVDLVKEQGFVVPNSCNDGRCGACIGTLESGNLNREKPENFLAENPTSDAFLACCCSVNTKALVSFQNLYPDIFPEPRHVIGKIKLRHAISSHLAIFRIRMRPGTGLNYIPGQFIGISTADIAERYYSIASFDEGSDNIDILVTRVAAGKMSDYLFANASEEKLITLHGPSGSFHLPEIHSGPIVAFVTGSGLGPILSILDELTSKSDARLFDFSIFWGYRNIEDGDITLEDNYPSVSFKRFCSKEDDPRAIGSYLTEYEFDEIYGANKFYLACGNPNMVNEIKTKLQTRGFNMANFGSDNFYHKGNMS